MTGETSVALVTGGTRGIGRAIVSALISDGWRVAFTYRDSVDAARRIESEHDGQARGFQLDVRDRARPDSLIREVEANVGPVSGLVNNAGIRHDALLAMTSDTGWDSVMETNVAGAFRCCRAALPGMVSRRHGSIVNISSLAAISGSVGQTAYAASKSALIGLTLSLAREVGKRNIRANVVVPGFVATDMTAGLSEAVVASLRDLECLPGGTSQDDVAGMVAFLLSDRGKAITGQVIAVDAGSSV